MSLPQANHTQICRLFTILLTLMSSRTTGFFTIHPRQHSTNTHHQSTFLHPQYTWSLTATGSSQDSIVGEQQRTLYEVLGAKGTETKQELKLLYTTLAKKHHPDAVLQQASISISQSSANNDNTTIAITPDSSSSLLNSLPSSSSDFSEIASAYKILSDPKQRQRYDRSLQAAKFSRDVSKWADQLGRRAAPAVNDILDSVAVPFLRRTTATTLAGIQAVSQDLAAANKAKSGLTNTTSATSSTATNSSTLIETNKSLKSGGGDFLQTFEKAMAAAKRAGKYVDSIELTEKSLELQQRAQETIEQAKLIDQQRRKIAERRIQLAIHTPLSGLTSADALFCLSELNETTTRLDELTMMDRLLLRNTVKDEIENLVRAENDYLESQQADGVAQSEYQRRLQAQVKLQIELKQAKVAEAEARLALEHAIAKVAATKTSLGRAADALSFAKGELEGTSNKMERKSHFLATQSERVRRHLVRKEKTVVEVRGKNLSSDAPQQTDFDEGDRYLYEIERLKNEERVLTDEYEQLDATASKYISRANILMQRAQEWKQA